MAPTARNSPASGVSIGGAATKRGNEEGAVESPGPEEITILLRQIGDGDERAIDELFRLVYTELRGLAQHHFNDQPARHTLQPTALIHEAYLRMVRADDLQVEDRSHFFALASRVMRQLLVDHCRRRRSQKRGGDWGQITLEGIAGDSRDLALEVIALDEALSHLTSLDERKAKVVELRYFGGLSNEEIATSLEVSTRTVESDWAFARAWLKRELSGSDEAT